MPELRAGKVNIVTYFPQRRSHMESVAETRLEPSKEWVRPELKKIDIEQITAAGHAHNADHHFPGS
jgi:hypothetical protein